ncbi:MAG: ribosome-associated translation inhibitor RaiA [bacterium]|uniref:Ribosomal subunit interface protein n=2 Tax=Bacteria candidate phyla TaxID=1783234 RepID=A0A101I2N2_UNCT6|nr:MAG: Ribosomal subunit interface protein [candidate division TA06 bacterium 32_111]KUK87518.1 MAG: Ribosomal subunit interface protein [candidate division TA06 bacterium 34_109]MDI6700328.1 ribosome-associated translation inhibitor RaiA [bacterium]HAF08146.1 ribosome-associated translation inhibitor RaiA [candidate division WOR-3 bacterium]HCP16708.1 ribosome-associated translation inhibitor RaiA [candidate division WOR-3 bacterium]
MNIKITGKHLEISPEIKNFIDESLKNIEKFERNIIDCEVLIELNGRRYKVEIDVDVKKHRFVSSDESYDLMTSIDKAIDKMKTQLKKFEEKKHVR